ncbi:LysR family transcriptional regulator [Massilia sp. Dwa41.01b]|uniref:LysR family transcriptional regulator n=1 Tax=unclassified Massilia TaxID=2609279 RepID=UPI0015FF6C5A|nr:MULTISPECIES: LysR family transcriptional regulator [unclassified Massilia]QNA87292.1 LysR family transcriptional regulator [Massilia sp. Dwa41.01b]QNA98197.1 LysR family transcriptional regulator [Massilia sp. Se16.2.3]
MKLDAMALFAQVAASGSFTAAAAAVGLPKSTVSARVAELEAALGMRLLHRTTRRLSLTAAGQVYLSHCRAMLEAANAADAAISRLRDEPGGHLRLTAPEASGILLLPPLLAAFHARHPVVTVECVITDSHLDLVAERIDLALRTGQLGDSSFVSRRVGTIRRVLVAAPGYLSAHGMPAHPLELDRHRLLLHGVLPQWPLHSEGKVITVNAAHAPLRANNLNTLRGLALAGAGIALLPWFMVREALADGSLALVLPEHRPTDNSYYAVYPGRSHRPAALSALLDFIDVYGLANYLS